MIRALALLARRRDITRDAFAEHYETVHAPLALPHLTGLKHYARNHIVEVLDPEEPGFDVLSQFGYADAKAIASVGKMLETSAAGEAIRRDGLTFMDREKNLFFAVRRRARRVAESGDAVKVALLVEAPSVSDAFFDAHLRDSVRPLADLALGFDHLEARGGIGATPPFHATTFLWLPRDHYDADALRAWAPAARRVVRLVVEEHVTIADEP
jgi:uncharacterized protein (TIGR02118 family)